MENLNIQLTEIVNQDQTGLEWVYNVSLLKTDENNITKNITMPVAVDSDNGKFLKSLVEETWNYVPSARDPLSQAKAQKLNSINKEYKQIEESGWDSGFGFFLGISANDVAFLTGAYILAKEASFLNLPLPTIIAMDNNPVTFANFEHMTQVMLQYGNARAEISSRFAAKRKAVELATSVEEVKAI